MKDFQHGLRHEQRQQSQFLPDQTSKDVTAFSGYNNNHHHHDKNSVSNSWVSDAFDGVHSFSLKGGGHTVRASELLFEEQVCGLLVLTAPHQDNNRMTIADTEAIRLRVCLPYMLYEEWNSQDETGPHDQTNRTSKQRHDKDVHHVVDGDDDDSNDDRNDRNHTDNMDDDLSGIGDENSNQIESKQQSGAALMSNQGTVSRVGLQSHPTFQMTSETESPRLRLLKSIAVMVKRTGFIVPELESFLIEEALPSWDGSNANETGRLLCYELLPMIRPAADWKRVLRHMDPLLCYGSTYLRVLIVSGFAATMLKRWAVLDEKDWVNDRSRKRKQRQLKASSGSTTVVSFKEKTFREVLDWCNDWLQKSTVLDDGSDSMRMAVLDYLEAAVIVSRQSDMIFVPSHSIVYGLMLSPTALPVDRLCRWMLEMKTLLQQRRMKQDGPDGADLAARCVSVSFFWQGFLDSSEGPNRRLRSHSMHLFSPLFFRGADTSGLTICVS